MELIYSHSHSTIYFIKFDHKLKFSEFQKFVFFDYESSSFRFCLKNLLIWMIRLICLITKSVTSFGYIKNKNSAYLLDYTTPAVKYISLFIKKILETLRINIKQSNALSGLPWYKQKMFRKYIVPRY